MRIVQRLPRQLYADAGRPHCYRHASAGTYPRLRPLLCSRLTHSILDGSVRRSEHRFAGSDVAVLLDDVRFGVEAHLRDLDVIVGGDTGDSDEKAGDVNRGEGIVKDEGGDRNGDDFLEDAADAEGDDGGALQEGELGGGHEEGEEAGEEEDGDAGDGALGLGQCGEAGGEGSGPFDGEGDEEEGEKHQRGEVEDAAEGVRGRRVAEQEDLRQAPAETGKEGGGDNEDEAKGVEGRFAGHHHDDADGHGGDDEDELDGWRFEAEEEGEEQHEG